MSLANIDIQILRDLDRHNCIPEAARDELRKMSLIEWEHLCYACFRHYNKHFRDKRELSMARRYSVGHDKESLVEPTLYLGVDPDTKGAIAVYCGKTQSIMCIIPFKGRSYDELRFAIRALGSENVVYALVEKQFTTPKDRADSVATLCTHYGRIVEMLESHNIRIVYERPQEWQKPLGIRSMIQGPNRKKELFNIALKRYPDALKLIKATAATGSGDACLIAEYGYTNKERFVNVN